MNKVIFTGKEEGMSINFKLDNTDVTFDFSNDNRWVSDYLNSQLLNDDFEVETQDFDLWEFYIMNADNLIEHIRKTIFLSLIELEGIK